MRSSTSSQICGRSSPNASSGWRRTRISWQAELDTARVTQERESADGLVEQLRNDLARVGDHLRIFGEQKASLEEAVAAAEARSQRIAAAERNAARSALVLRDLARELRQPLGAGEIEIDLELGRPLVRIEKTKLWSKVIRPLRRRARNARAR